MENPNKPLEEYIKNALNQGQSRDQIYKDLLNQGWQLQQIDEQYKPSGVEVSAPDTRKRTTNIIVIFGAILVGLGILSFIASNWQAIPSAVKVLIIVLAIIIFDVLGWFLKERLEYSRTGDALYLLGSITYGSGIYLVAQIYNIRANWPDGMLLWLLGTVAMAYALDAFPLYFLAVPLGIVAVIGYPFYLLDPYIENSFIYTSTTLIILTFAATLFLGIRMRSKMSDELKQM